MAVQPLTSSWQQNYCEWVARICLTVCEMPTRINWCHSDCIWNCLLCIVLLHNQTVSLSSPHQTWQNTSTESTFCLFAIIAYYKMSPIALSH